MIDFLLIFSILILNVFYYRRIKSYASSVLFFSFLIVVNIIIGEYEFSKAVINNYGALHLYVSLSALQYVRHETLLFLIFFVLSALLMSKKQKHLFTFKLIISSKFMTSASIPVSIFVLACGIFGVGYHAIWIRVGYLPVSMPLLKNIANGLLLPSMFLLGASSLGSRLRRVLKAALLLSVLLFEFSMASRALALVLPAYIFGNYTSTSKYRWFVFYLLLSLALIPLFLWIVLNARSLPIQGIYPFLMWIKHGAYTVDPAQVWSFGALLRAQTYGYPLAAYVAKQGSFSVADLLVSINPLPGFMAGWSTLWWKLRVNQFTPYNTWGELLCVLGPYFPLAGAIYGFYFGFVDSILYGARLKSSPLIIRGMIFGSVILGSIIFLEYNTRNSVRVMFYGAFFFFFVLLLKMFKIKKETKRI